MFTQVPPVGTRVMRVQRDFTGARPPRLLFGNVSDWRTGDVPAGDVVVRSDGSQIPRVFVHWDEPAGPRQAKKRWCPIDLLAPVPAHVMHPNQIDPDEFFTPQGWPRPEPVGTHLHTYAETAFACDQDPAGLLAERHAEWKAAGDMQTASAMVTLTRELERLRDACVDDDEYPQDQGRREAFNEAIGLASSAALLAMGVGRRAR